MDILQLVIYIISGIVGFVGAANFLVWLSGAPQEAAKKANQWNKGTQTNIDEGISK